MLCVILNYLDLDSPFLYFALFCVVYSTRSRWLLNSKEKYTDGLVAEREMKAMAREEKVKVINTWSSVMVVLEHGVVVEHRAAFSLSPLFSNAIQMSS